MDRKRQLDRNPYFVPEKSDRSHHLHLVVTEGLHGLTSRALQHDVKVLRGVDDTHSLSSASLDGLDEDGVSDLGGLGLQEGVVLVFAVVTGDNGDLSSLHDELGLTLGSHGGHGAGGGSDEGDVLLGKAVSKAGVL